MITPSFTTLAAVGTALAGVASSSPVEARAPTGNFKDVMIKGHNWYRDQHAAAALRWDDGAAANAANWVKNCKFEHQVRASFLSQRIHEERPCPTNKNIYTV